MQLVRLVVVVAGFFVFSGFASAQNSTTDYNENLKAQLKQEDAPATPPKKVVHKKIHKSVKKSLPSKTVKVAQATDSTEGTTAVKVRDSDVIEGTADSAEAPVLGQSATNTQKYGYQPQPYQPIFILNPSAAQLAAAGAPPSTYVAQAAPSQGASSGAVVAAPQGSTSGAALAAPVTAAGAAAVQPTTNVDSTAVPEPKSEALRRQRNDLEHQTESKLIERLEDDRLQSEKDRADRILNPQPSPAPAVGPIAVEVAGPQPAPSAAPQAPPAAPAEVIATQPAPMAAPGAAPAPTTAAGESVVKADANTAKPADTEKRFSVGPMAGIPNYPTVSNVTSYYTLGVLGQYKFEHRLSLQTAFDYSKFDIHNANFCPFCWGGTLVKGVDQYNFSVGLNYNILPYSITPVVGVLVDYARRNYTDKVDYGYSYGTPTGSNAFDAGLMAGVDLKLSEALILGFQFAYMWNISYWTDDPLAYGYYGNIYGQPLESLSYYTGTLNLRFMF